MVGFGSNSAVYSDLTSTSTALHGPAWRRSRLAAGLRSREPDILRASKLEHAVQRADGDSQRSGRHYRLTPPHSVPQAPFSAPFFCIFLQ